MEQNQDNSENIMQIETTAIYQQDAAMVDRQVSTAHAYPRKIRESVDNAIVIVTLDKDVAATCTYSVPRGGKAITGPSVHLAKVLAQTWKNMRVEAKVVSIDAKHVTSEAVAWDLESNVAIKTQVKRSIIGKYGRFNDDLITVTGNAANSIALRNAILSVIPRGVVDKVYGAAMQTITGDISDENKLKARRKEVFDGLMQTYNLTEREVLAAVGKQALVHVTGDDLVVLIGIGQAIKDGDTTVETAFKERETKSADINKGAEAKVAASSTAAGAQGTAAPASFKDLKVITNIDTTNVRSESVPAGYVGICTSDDGTMVSLDNGYINCPRGLIKQADASALTTAEIAAGSLPAEPAVIRTDYTLPELEVMETTPLIRQIAAKYCDVDKLGQSRVTNKLLRNLIIAAQNGTLKSLITQYYPGKEDAIKTDYVEKTQAASSAAPAAEGTSAGTTAAATSTTSVDELLAANLVDVLSGVERDADETLKVFSHLQKTGITDDNILPVLEKLGGGFIDIYQNVEHICKSAPLADIKAIIEKFNSK